MQQNQFNNQSDFLQIQNQSQSQIQQNQFKNQQSRTSKPSETIFKTSLKTGQFKNQFLGLDQTNLENKTPTQPEAIKFFQHLLKTTLPALQKKDQNLLDQNQFKQFLFNNPNFLQQYQTNLQTLRDPLRNLDLQHLQTSAFNTSKTINHRLDQFNEIPQTPETLQDHLQDLADPSNSQFYLNALKALKTNLGQSQIFNQFNNQPLQKKNQFNFLDSQQSQQQSFNQSQQIQSFNQSQTFGLDQNQSFNQLQIQQNQFKNRLNQSNNQQNQQQFSGQQLNLLDSQIQQNQFNNQSDFLQIQNQSHQPETLKDFKDSKIFPKHITFASKEEKISDFEYALLQQILKIEKDFKINFNQTNPFGQPQFQSSMFAKKPIKDFFQPFNQTQNYLQTNLKKTLQDLENKTSKPNFLETQSPKEKLQFLSLLNVITKTIDVLQTQPNQFQQTNLLDPEILNLQTNLKKTLETLPLETQFQDLQKNLLLDSQSFGFLTQETSIFEFLDALQYWSNSLETLPLETQFQDLDLEELRERLELFQILRDLQPQYKSLLGNFNPQNAILALQQALKTNLETKTQADLQSLRDLENSNNPTTKRQKALLKNLEDQIPEYKKALETLQNLPLQNKKDKKILEALKTNLKNLEAKSDDLIGSNPTEMINNFRQLQPQNFLDSQSQNLQTAFNQSNPFNQKDQKFQDLRQHSKHITNKEQIQILVEANEAFQKLLGQYQKEFGELPEGLLNGIRNFSKTFMETINDETTISDKALQNLQRAMKILEEEIEKNGIKFPFLMKFIPIFWIIEEIINRIVVGKEMGALKKVKNSLLQNLENSTQTQGNISLLQKKNIPQQILDSQDKLLKHHINFIDNCGKTLENPPNFDLTKSLSSF